MDPESFFIGVGLGLAPGLVIATALALRWIAQIGEIGKEVSTLVRSFTRAPSGGSGGLMGLAQTFLPMLAGKLGPK